MLRIYNFPVEILWTASTAIDVKTKTGEEKNGIHVLYY